MKRRTWSVAMIPLLLLGSCTDRPPTAAATDGAIAPRSNDSYSTYEEWVAEGSPIGAGSYSTTTTEWLNGFASLKTSSQIHIDAGVNDWDIIIAATVLPTAGGAAINSTPHQESNTSALPTAQASTLTSSATASTGNHKCGIIGKGYTAGYVGRRLQNPLNNSTYLIGTTGIASEAADRTLRNCPKAIMAMNDGNESSATTLEYRHPGSVSFSATSSSVDGGSPTCEWKIDGTSSGTSCAGYVNSTLTVGSHSVELKVSDSEDNQDSAFGSITVAPSCSSTDTTVIHDALRADGISSHAANPFGKVSTVAPCGQTTTPGSSGAPPPSSPQNTMSCAWSRYLLIFEDGSWIWWGDWFYHCEFDEIRDGVSSIQHKEPLRVRVLGSGRLANGQRIVVQRDSLSSRDAVITIDTTRADPADVAHALSAVEGLVIARGRPTDNSIYAAFLGETTSRVSELEKSSRSYVDASKLLRDLLKAQEVTTKEQKKARAVNVTIDRKK